MQMCQWLRHFCCPLGILRILHKQSDVFVLSTAYRTAPILFQIILVRWGLDPAIGFQAWCLWAVGIYVFSSGKAWVISLLTLIQNLDRFLTEPSLRNHLEPVEVLGSIIAAVCHDLDHPGLTDMTWFHWTSGSWCSHYTHDVTKLFQSFSLTMQTTFFNSLSPKHWKTWNSPLPFLFAALICKNASF